MVTVVEIEELGDCPLETGLVLPICGASVRSVPPSALRRMSAARVVVVGGELEGGVPSVLSSKVVPWGDVLPDIDFFPGIGRLSKLEDMLSKLPKPPDCWLHGGSGGSVQGDNRYLIQSSILKKSTGYFSLVLMSKKQPPSSGSKTKLVRNVKFTCAVSTRELSRTASPFRIGPKMFTHDFGTPA